MILLVLYLILARIDHTLGKAETLKPKLVKLVSDLQKIPSRSQQAEITAVHVDYNIKIEDAVNNKDFSLAQQLKEKKTSLDYSEEQITTLDQQRNDVLVLGDHIMVKYNEIMEDLVKEKHFQNAHELYALFKQYETWKLEYESFNSNAVFKNSNEPKSVSSTAENEATVTIAKAAKTDVKINAMKGEGSFFVVYEGKWKSQTVAVKVLKHATLLGRSKSALETELAILSNLRYDRIVNLLGLCENLIVENKPSIGLLLEYMEGGNLFDFLHDTNMKPSGVPLNKYRVALDIVEGMVYLHDKRIIHRDLKSGNILLTTEQSTIRAKVSDFGYSRKQESERSNVTGGIGTVAWCSPEALREEEDGIRASSDVYSFGVVLWELATGQVPWGSFGIGRIASEIAMKRSVLETSPSTMLSDYIRSMCSNCLAYDAKNRPAFTDLHDSFIQDQHIIQQTSDFLSSL